MEMQLQTKDTLATLHLDPRTKLYLLIVGNVALFLAPSLLYEIALVVCVVILGVLVGAKRFTVRMAAVYAGMVVLHAENAVAIQKGIEEMIKGKTVFLVSHTLSYIQNADQILVLSDGILQGCGKHEELLQTVPLYQTMWEKEKSIKNWKLA